MQMLVPSRWRKFCLVLKESLLRLGREKSQIYPLKFPWHLHQTFLKCTKADRCHLVSYQQLAESFDALQIEKILLDTGVTEMSEKYLAPL